VPPDVFPAHILPDAYGPKERLISGLAARKAQNIPIFIHRNEAGCGRTGEANIALARPGFAKVFARKLNNFVLARRYRPDDFNAVNEGGKASGVFVEVV
jgi:hypothetical protein